MTVDAVGCQTAIAERILARGADYLLTLKANHPLAYQAVAEHFEQHCFRRGAPSRADCDAFDDTHGRLVRRRVFASTEAAKLEALSAWPRLHTVLAVETIRSVNGRPKVAASVLANTRRRTRRPCVSSKASQSARLGAPTRKQCWSKCSTTAACASGWLPLSVSR